MYALEEIAAEADAFRDAVSRLDGFRPLSVKLKVVDGCNLSCGMCRHWLRTERRWLPLERLEALLVELARLGCRKVHLTGGEPALRPDLEAIVEAGTRVGLRMTLTTNGTLVTRARARRLVEGGLRAVAVSIDSPDAEMHDRQRGQEGAFARAVEGTHNLRKEARRGKLAIALNTVVTRLNWRTLGGLPRLALRLGARNVRLLPVDGHAGTSMALNADEIAAFNREIAPGFEEAALRLGLIAEASDAWPFGRTAAQAAHAAAGEHALGYYRERPCYAPFTHSLVDQRGRVFVCCMARGEASLGSVAAGPFLDVWRSPAYREARRVVLSPERLAPCARCDDFLDENRRIERLVEWRAAGAA
jgi:MoaA/NifB/PqqE/SkfB family radical SAM enzyme